jgi:membrane protease YdiL (CAAX protease family)
VRSTPAYKAHNRKYQRNYHRSQVSKNPDRWQQSPNWPGFDRVQPNPGSPQKIAYYITICAWLWIASFVAVANVGVREVFTIAPMPNDASWLFGHGWVRFLVEAVIALFFGMTFLSCAIVVWKKLNDRPRTYRSAKALRSLEYFFPATQRERHWWVLVCITAGVCEETLFRGFMLHYLHVLPCTLNLTLALLISSLVFGLNHFYGGVGGVVGSAIAGFLFGLLFLLSGNLLLPVVLHALTDLRALVILPTRAELTAPLSTASDS